MLTIVSMLLVILIPVIFSLVAPNTKGSRSIFFASLLFSINISILSWITMGSKIFYDPPKFENNTTVSFVVFGYPASLCVTVNEMLNPNAGNYVNTRIQLKDTENLLASGTSCQHLDYEKVEPLKFKTNVLMIVSGDSVNNIAMDKGAMKAGWHISNQILPTASDLQITSNESLKSNGLMPGDIKFKDADYEAILKKAADLSYSKKIATRLIVLCGCVDDNKYSYSFPLAYDTRLDTPVSTIVRGPSIGSSLTYQYLYGNKYNKYSTGFEGAYKDPWFTLPDEWMPKESPDFIKYSYKFYSSKGDSYLSYRWWLPQISTYQYQLLNDQNLYYRNKYINQYYTHEPGGHFLNEFPKQSWIDEGGYWSTGSFNNGVASNEILNPTVTIGNSGKEKRLSNLTFLFGIILGVAGSFLAKSIEIFLEILYNKKRVNKSKPKIIPLDSNTFDI